MRFGYIIFILIVGCGEPRGDPQVVVDLSKEKAEVIFAGEAKNGHYCFYTNSVDKEVLSLFSTDGQTDQSSFSELGGKKKLDYSKVSEGSALLTERSISSKDLHSPLAGSSKWSNIAGNASVFPYRIPLATICMISFFSGSLVWIGVGCLPSLASFVVSYRAVWKAKAEGQRKLGSLLSSNIYNNPLLVSELRKIFQWLESENSIICPEQPRIKQ